jgi:co-chaperonin GroES (HSP10)
MKTIEPLGHRVLVKPEKVEDVDPAIRKARMAGLDLSAITGDKREQEAVVIGTVVKVGATAWKDPSLGGVPWAVPGDRVFFAKFSGKSVSLNGEDPLLIMNDEDIVAAIREE